MRITTHSTDRTHWRIHLHADSDDETSASLDEATLVTLERALERAKQAPDCRVLTLQGGPGTFCVGMDLAAATSLEVIDPAVDAYRRCLQALCDSRLVILAAVDGAALGGGVGLVAAADLVVATHSSRFGLPELYFGLVPAMVLPVLLQRVTPQKARWLALSGVAIDAPAALELGLVDEVVADGPALEASIRRQARHLRRADPEAIATLRRQCSRASFLPTRTALDQGAACTGKLLRRPRTQKALRAALHGDRLPWQDDASREGVA